MRKAFIVIIFLMSCIISKSTAQLPWAVFHGCEKRCGIFPVQEYRDFGRVKWKFKTEGKIFSSPAVQGGVAYIGSEDSHLYAVDTETGELKWKFATGGAIHSSPAYFNGSVYFGSFDGFYYALDAETGKQRWKFRTGGEKWMGGKDYFGWKPAAKYHNDLWDYFLSSPALDFQDNGSALYFGSSDGFLYSVNAASGKLNWKFKTGGIIHSSPALRDGKVYIGSWDSKMYAIDAATGNEVWSYETGTKPGMNGIQASPALDDGKVFFGARDGYFYALNAETGSLEWKYSADNSWIISTAGAKDGVVYVGTSDSYLLLALDGKTGEEKFRFKTSGYVYSSPAITGNTIFFGDFTGKMFALDVSSGGKKWKEFMTDSRKEKAAAVLGPAGEMNFNELTAGSDKTLYQTNKAAMDRLFSLGSVVSSPAVGEGVIYFGSADGNLYAVGLEGAVSETDPDSGGSKDPSTEHGLSEKESDSSPHDQHH